MICLRRTTQAQQALAKSQKTHALSYLRSKKDLEQVLAKRTSSLGMLQGVLLKMDSSAGDVAVRSFLSPLRASFPRTGLLLTRAP